VNRWLPGLNQAAGPRFRTVFIWSESIGRSRDGLCRPCRGFLSARGILPLAWPEFVRGTSSRTRNLGVVTCILYNLRYKGETDWLEPRLLKRLGPVSGQPGEIREAY
jgi:hypothetical protein